MTCGDCRLQISGYLDGALSAAECRQVRAHVEQCHSCRDFLEEQRRITTWLRSESFELELPDRLWGGIRSRLVTPAPAATPPARRFVEVPGWAYALAASLLLALVSAALFRPVERLDHGLLAQLNAYDVPVAGNPFLAEPGESNPFFEPIAEVEGNPFDLMRSPK